MTGSENPKNAKANIEDVLAEFDGKKDVLARFCERTRGLIEEILKDAEIQYESVQARVKGRNKLREKYLNPDKNYKRLDDITDQVALRVITYYEDEAVRVANMIRREFEIDPEKSVDKRETEPDRFGYYSLNYVCKYTQERTSHVEYKKFADVCFEIQVTSILRHAWSEIEHPWYDLKSAFPDSIKRRFARMAALLEIAESEFLSLKKLQRDYQQSVAVQVEAQVPDLPVDAVSLRSFIEQDPLVGEIDKSLAVALGASVVIEEAPDSVVEKRSRAVNAAGMANLQRLRASLRKYRSSIPEYVRRCQQELWPHIEAGHQLSISKGVSIFHLCLILANVQGAEATVKFLKEFGFNPSWDVARQVEIAKETVAKHLS